MATKIVKEFVKTTPKKLTASTFVKAVVIVFQ